MKGKMMKTIKMMKMVRFTDEDEKSRFFKV